MRILILGGDGMLGHQLLRSWAGRHEVRVTLRRDLEQYSSFGLFPKGIAYDGVDLRHAEALVPVLADFRPEAVVNAAGIVKQRPESKEVIPSLELNALLPHRLALLCRACGAALVHLSTDCVFSGRRGGYRESDPSDAEDLYGKSKYLGEVSDPGCITLRTSIIGPELSRKSGLLEWFLAQRGRTVKGFTRAIFSGFTTIEMARIIERVLTTADRPSGLFHVSSDPISKHNLLVLIRDRIGLDIEVDADDQFHCDRSLDSSGFRQAFAYRPPSWPYMVDELAKDLRGEQP